MNSYTGQHIDRTDSFREAVAAARAVLDVLHAAEAKLLAAISAVPRGGRSTP
jgi:hypothetical protein